MRSRGPQSFQGSWLIRAIRGARIDRNPLRRGIDRLETCLLVCLFVALAAGTPFVARLAANASYASALHARQEQVATRHQVRAVLSANAGQVNGYAPSEYVLTPATWTSVSGVHRSGMVPAEPGSRAGTALTVWTDTDGALDNPPLPAAEVSSQADATRVGVIVVACVFYVGVAGAIRQLMHRRRMAAWEADWLITAQMWNRQSW